MPTNYLVDTSVIIDALRGNKKAQVFINNLGTISISIVTQSELLEGSRNKKEMQEIGKAVQGFHILYPSRAIYNKAINFIESYHLQYGILFDDAIIAAIAIENNLILATTEKKHFKPINSLQLYNPCQ